MSEEEQQPVNDDTSSNEDDFLAAFAASSQVDEEIDADYERTLEAIEAVERDLELPDEQPVEETAEPPKSSSTSVKREVRIPPRQIIEAALFVGGKPLTTKKLCSLLDDINRQYIEEARPYEIRMEEGGYRLILRHDFERIRNRVYGFGPKEVKLSQDALEVLALVAYQQPITKDQIIEAGKDKANGVLRQLLRRELIAIERNEDKKAEVKYITTARFLQVFGLGNIEELPYIESLSHK